MRIGLDLTPLSAPHSGVRTYTANLFDQLSNLPNDEIVPLIQGPDLTSSESSARGRRKLVNKTVWMQAFLPWQLARLGVEVCHFTNHVGSLWTPCPSVITIHDMTLWLFPELHPRRRLLSMRTIMPLAARRASAIIAVSQSAKRDIVSILGVPEEKVHVIYEAPEPRFQVLTARAELEAVRRRHRLPERFILCVGTIEPRKNLVRLLEAFARLRQNEHDSCSLVLVGRRGWKESRVFATAERLGLGESVRFAGYVPQNDLAAFYNLADVVAFPSLYEGFGLPVVEAMACGTPVVTSENSSLGEIAGDAAEIVVPTDVNSIADGLHRVLTDPTRRAELRAKGLVRAARLNWTEAAEQTRALYAWAAGESHARLGSSVA